MSGFDQIIGNEDTIAFLKKTIQEQKVNHALIIQGDVGSGKMLLAETYAQALLCETQSGDACGRCHSCHQVLSHNHPDIRYVKHEEGRT